MTIADVFTQFLGENMYPDDDLPEFVCCDCLEERLECAGKEVFTRSRCKLPLQKPEEGKELRNLDVSDCGLFRRGCVRKIHTSGIQSETELEDCLEYKNSAFHQCNICSGIFLDSSDLKHHKNVFHSIVESIPCGRCWKKFWSWEALARHIERYNFQCKFETKHTASSYAVNHIPLKEKDVCQRIPDGSDEGNQTLPIHAEDEGQSAGLQFSLGPGSDHT
ncbi:hypothetical protein J437_LFUL013457 [Ladona fulva]|uniref:C2H2-type domain-containing protein n=1 Tax=Ladona fulva TaxID=123851 RepID=A0A8K0KFK7_LADFU|nr:hypothetical protein J437_LFUL013457 [Ladona fulva]